MQSGEIISVVITTKNEEDAIGRLIQSIKRQSYKKIEIILVDNNSTDKTADIAKKAGVRVYNFGPERSAQRNLGANIAKGKYLLFVDADMELSPDVLKECVEVCYKNSDVGGVAIPEQSKAKNFWERVKAFERSFYNEKGDPITDAARFFKKEVFFKVGGYDETITGPEDWDFSESIKKSGYTIGRVNSLIYHNERIKSLLDLAGKKFYYALNLHRYLFKQKIPVFSPKTIYFLRPVFYKHFDRVLAHPVLSLGMIIMLFLELCGGGLGYLVGRLRR